MTAAVKVVVKVAVGSAVVGSAVVDLDLEVVDLEAADSAVVDSAAVGTRACYSQRVETDTNYSHYTIQNWNASMYNDSCPIRTICETTTTPPNYSS